MDHTHGRTGESLLQLEIQKVQQTFAMSANDEPEEFEDIQFFHRLPPQLHSFRSGNSGGDVIRGGFLNTASGSDVDSSDASESPYVFPENVMEYGEPQFFPGNCVGYLETILEETDEEYEEEEGSSGRHWWTADSDSDTASVIRNPLPLSDPIHQPSPNNPKCLPSFDTPASFRTTASSKPFELEDLYLLDQLDLAFEETLMKPRRRTGFAFTRDLEFLESSAAQKLGEPDLLPLVPLPKDKSLSPLPLPAEPEPELDEEENTLCPEDDEEPPEVNEEDFFYSTSEEEGDQSGLSETGEEETTSSSDEEKKASVVLAEFSLNSSFNTAIYKNHRRSFETPSKIRSFRSFDSLNSLAGTELLFSKADTFPSFHYIKEVAEPSLTAEQQGGSSSRSSSNTDEGDKMEVSRKNSGEVSSENLSEDSGISDATGLGSVPVLTEVGAIQTQGHCLFSGKPEFALNPLIYSSASEENSMSMGSIETPVYMFSEQRPCPVTLVEASRLSNQSNNHPIPQHEAQLEENNGKALANSDCVPAPEQGLADPGPVNMQDDVEPAQRDMDEVDSYYVKHVNNHIPEIEMTSCEELKDIACNSSSPAHNVLQPDTELSRGSSEGESEMWPIVPNNELGAEGSRRTSTSDYGSPQHEYVECVGKSGPMSTVTLDSPSELKQESHTGSKDAASINRHINSASRGSVPNENELGSGSVGFDWMPELLAGVSGSLQELLHPPSSSQQQTHTEDVVDHPCTSILGRSNFGLEETQFPPETPSSSVLFEPDDGLIEIEETLHLCGKAWVCGSTQLNSESDSVRISSSAEHVSVPDVILDGERPTRMDSPTTPSPVPHKTYGSRNEVEVFLVSSRTPSPPVTIVKPGIQKQGSVESPLLHPDTGSLKTKTVHFSPVVSEISWRESYTDPGSEDQFSESSSDNQFSQEYPEGQGHDLTPPPLEPVEKVHVHTQLISEPQLAPPPKRSEKERLRELEPELPSPVLPDLLRQCESASLPQAHVNIEEQIQTQPIPLPIQHEHPHQQQIFPSMFVATGKEAAGAAKSKNNSKPSKKTFSIPLTSAKSKSASAPPKPEREDVRVKVLEGPELSNFNNKSKEKDKSKPGFFQRLSKIRLSGSNSGTKNKAAKVKIYPKDKEPQQQEAPMKPKAPYQMAAPILKKTNGSTSPGIQIQAQAQTPPPSDPVQDECSEAFENILEEIAGLNTILQRQNMSTNPSSSGKRSFAERKQFLSNPETEVAVQSSDLEQKLSQFKEEASKTRDQISKAQPDLERMEGVSRQGVSPSNGEASHIQMRSKSKAGKGGSTSSPKTQEDAAGAERKTEREWYKLLKTAAEKYYHGGRGSSSDKNVTKTGIVETDLDTGTSREMLDAEFVVLELESTTPPPLPSSLAPYSGTNGSTNGAKARSLNNLTSGLKLSLAPADPCLSHEIIDGRLDELLNDVDERAKSLEFLLDENQKNLSVPPENQLRLENRQLSEHELRIQRSLSKLNVPDWYRKHQHGGRSKSMERPLESSRDQPFVSPSGTTSTSALKLLKRSEYGSSSGLAGGWAGLSAYRTPSLSSLQNARYAGSLNRSNFVRGRPVTMSVTRSSRESLMSPSSTASQSPSAFERSSFTYGMPLSLVRHGHSRLSSTSGTSPGSISPASTPGPTSAPYVRKPYLGWRSQERLSASGASGSPASSTGGPRLSAYRPPAERLAAELHTLRPKAPPNRPTGTDRPPLPKPPPRSDKTALTQEGTPKRPPSDRDRQSPNVHDSIREVTHAINEFVSHGSEGPPKPMPRQKHPKTPAVWFESSFVGQKPK